MGFFTKKRSIDVGSYAKDTVRGLETARDSARRPNLYVLSYFTPQAVLPRLWIEVAWSKANDQETGTKMGPTRQVRRLALRYSDTHCSQNSRSKIHFKMLGSPRSTAPLSVGRVLEEHIASVAHTKKNTAREMETRN